MQIFFTCSVFSIFVFSKVNHYAAKIKSAIIVLQLIQLYNNLSIIVAFINTIICYLLLRKLLNKLQKDKLI